MHRRGVGLAAFDRHEQSKRSFAQLSTDLSHSQLLHLNSQLSLFRNALAHFAATHRQSIRTDPAFRLAFQQMCSSIGVDPLAGPRKGGWWAELLGFGDWHYELAVQIIDVCLTTRHINGGLIDMSDLLNLITKLRGLTGGVITQHDVLASINTLQPLGAGYHVLDVAGRKMVRSVVKELDHDQAVVLAIAREEHGRVVDHFLVHRNRWTPERARTALHNMLLRDGLCWLDDQDEQYGTAYWVPSVIQWNF